MVFNTMVKKASKQINIFIEMPASLRPREQISEQRKTNPIFGV
jgi:hypothetical protein